MQRINERFRRAPFHAEWNADGVLADAGLLVHIFDGWEVGASFEAAPSEMSTSLIYADQHPTCCPNLNIPTYSGWATGVQGLIFRPGPTTRILCGTSGDSNNGKCKEWCPSIPLEGDDYDPNNSPQGAGGCRGSWHPEDFGVFLYRTNLFETEVQSRWGRRLDYNEIVVSGSHWTQHLPTTIDAFFQSPDHGKGRRNDHVAREQHEGFLRKYNLSPEEVPLLEFDPHNWDTPFREVA